MKSPRGRLRDWQRMTAFLICLLVAVGTSILMVLSDKLERADLRKVVLRKQITSQQARRRGRPMDFGSTATSTSSPTGCGACGKAGPFKCTQRIALCRHVRYRHARCNPEDPT